LSSEWDLNPHAFRQQILNLPCLPIPSSEVNRRGGI
jgi:hypothetical protein